jgi:hypothetical protein
VHGNNTRNLAISLSQTSKNAMFFLLSYGFFLLQNREQEGGTGEVPIMYTHISKCKMITAETVLGIGGEGMKKSSRGGEIKYGIFDIL